MGELRVRHLRLVLARKAVRASVAMADDNPKVKIGPCRQRFTSPDQVALVTWPGRRILKELALNVIAITEWGEVLDYAS